MTVNLHSSRVGTYFPTSLISLDQWVFVCLFLFVCFTQTTWQGNVPVLSQDFKAFCMFLLLLLLTRTCRKVWASLVKKPHGRRKTIQPGASWTSQTAKLSSDFVCPPDSKKHLSESSLNSQLRTIRYIHGYCFNPLLQG